MDAVQLFSGAAQAIAVLFVAAWVVETLTERTMGLLPQEWEMVGKFHVPPFVALAWALLVAFATGLDLFALLGLQTALPAARWLGVLMSALVIQRGSQATHDFVNGLEAWKQANRAKRGE